MKSTSSYILDQPKRKWYQKINVWISIGVFLLVVTIIILTSVLMIRKLKEKNNATHIHYTRISTTTYNNKYEMYRLTILKNRNPAQQYKFLGNFLRRSLFNKSNYEKYLPLCPIILGVTTIDHPEDWRALLFATMKLNSPSIQHPYICYLSVLPEERRNRLGSLLLNQFLNDMQKQTNPSITHVQLHANWENCRAQFLYNKCGFRCNQFTLDGYPPPFEPEFEFGHMIRMELDMANIHQFANVCFNASAIQISSEDENNSKQLCDKDRPAHLNKTCEKNPKP